MTYKANLIISILIVIVLIVLALFATLVLTPHRQGQLSPVMKCGTRLFRLGKALLIYANDHNDVVPHSFDNLNNYIEGDTPFHCPGSGVEYVLVQDLTYDMPHDTILAYCPEKHHLYDPKIGGIGDNLGMNILPLSSAVQTIKISEVNELFTDQGIDLNSHNSTHNQPLQ